MLAVKALLSGLGAGFCQSHHFCRSLVSTATLQEQLLSHLPHFANTVPTSSPPAYRLSEVLGETRSRLLHETIGANLERTVEQFPGKEALISIHQGVRLTYKEFGLHVDEIARGLLALGVQQRDRVGIWAPNCAEWAVLQYATAKVGAILVNINPSYRANELAFALRQSGVCVLVMASELRGTSFPDVLESVAEEAPKIRHKVVLGAEPPAVRGGPAAAKLGSSMAAGYLDWYDVRWAGEGAGLAAALQQRAARLRPDDPINIQYTSGTTGLPKGATLSHRNVLNNGYLVGRGCGYTHADRVCIPVPLYHCFGMVMGNLACTSHGATMVYPSDCFDAEATLRAVEQEGCTSLYGVPTMFIAELEHPRFQQYGLDTLRTGIMAGSTCPEEVMRRVRQEMHMRDVTICYGMTETSPVSFQTSPTDTIDKRVSTVGRIHPHLQARVVEPGTSQVLPSGETGELCVRGYSTMLGYWNDAQATAKSLTQDGWMRTGDLATLDPEGYCRIVGRIKDMVIRGGENIYPREIEEFLHKHPAVSDVQVFGVPDSKYGEELCAWVRLKEGCEAVSEGELRAWCKGRIAHFKVPRHWKFVESYPMTVSGKPQKYLMRQQAALELEQLRIILQAGTNSEAAAAEQGGGAAVERQLEGTAAASA